eukprot:scaffold1931_cov215-Ochromonas_danica.AAC.33
MDASTPISPTLLEKKKLSEHQSLSKIQAHKPPSALPPVTSAILDDVRLPSNTESDLASRLHAKQNESFQAFETPLKGKLADLHVGRSPLKDLQVSLPVNRQEVLWSSWIMVFGFDTTQSPSNILQRFQTFGEIVQHRLGAGNWLFIRYYSPVQAERAACQHMTYLSSTSMAGVQQMNSSLGRQMNLRLTEDGGLVTDDAAQTYWSNPEELQLRRRQRGRVESVAQHSEVDADSQEDDGLYLRPQRRKSVCEQLLDYFWAY